jgi:hypothetical protein
MINYSYIQCELSTYHQNNKLETKNPALFFFSYIFWSQNFDRKSPETTSQNIASFDENQSKTIFYCMQVARIITPKL